MLRWLNGVSPSRGPRAWLPSVVGRHGRSRADSEPRPAYRGVIATDVVELDCTQYGGTLKE
jgi:hypothetical protein